MAIERTEHALDVSATSRERGGVRFRLLHGSAPKAPEAGARLLRECRDRPRTALQDVAHAVRERLLHAASHPLRRPEVSRPGDVRSFRARPSRGAARWVASLVWSVARRIVVRLAHSGVR